MSIVIRCPKCGTTSAGPGECDACHEAQVRYFCTNHEPGVWLDGPTCAACNARRSEAALRPPPTESAVPVPRSPAPARAPKTRSARRSVTERPRPEIAEEDPWAHDERLHHPDESLVPGPVGGPLWQKILQAALVARSMRLPEAPESDGKSLRRMGGCLVRLVLVGVMLIVALITALYIFGSSML